ncbi:hypothetical protein L1887_36681 [Cichorium endivia]|nr:hypothetical protein L1887_36681 [Cichorium endivia]
MRPFDDEVLLMDFGRLNSTCTHCSNLIVLISFFSYRDRGFIVGSVGLNHNLLVKAKSKSELDNDVRNCS